MVENKLRTLRERHEVSQVELAAAIEVSRQTIHAIETSKYVPSVELALRIAEFFALEVEDIFTLKTERRGVKAK